jgi:AraC-like DNA-binding protein
MITIPQALHPAEGLDFLVYPYEGRQEWHRNKIALSYYVISFIRHGEKQVNFAGHSIRIDHRSALLMTPGNCLMAERGHDQQDYQSMLFFFSKNQLVQMLANLGVGSAGSEPGTALPYYEIAQDSFIRNFVQSLEAYSDLEMKHAQQLLELKAREIMLYLLQTYGEGFAQFLLQSIPSAATLSFRQTIEANRYNNLSLEELAFLCNMSLSTFKRHFQEQYGDSPGNWFKQRRLEKARQQLLAGEARAAEVYSMAGYKNLAHFSTAFKSRFGKSPKHSYAD